MYIGLPTDIGSKPLVLIATNLIPKVPPETAPALVVPIPVINPDVCSIANELPLGSISYDASCVSIRMLGATV